MEDYVLVEVIADHISGAAVVFAAVCQDQSAELLELAYRVVSCGAGLAALESRDTDADVSLSDHSDIVRAITIFVLPLSEDELDLLGYGILTSSRDFNSWEEGQDEYKTRHTKQILWHNKMNLSYNLIPQKCRIIRYSLILQSVNRKCIG